MDVRKRVGRNLKQLREQKELTQEALADRANVHQTYISGVESGYRNPSIQVLERLAKGVGVDIARFFER
jgi:transcriptional regulator with XRE-family HTH domain